MSVGLRGAELYEKERFFGEPIFGSPLAREFCGCQRGCLGGICGSMRICGFALLWGALATGLLVLAGCGRGEQSTGESKRTLTVFAAASLGEAVREVGEAFSEDEGVEIVYNLAGSGALAQQLIAAPRADVYLSASERWMDAVVEAGRSLEGSRRELLSNRLVVVANAESVYGISRLEDLAELDFSYLAMGDPLSVPAGAYAKAFLEDVVLEDGRSLWDVLRKKVSPTPDVRAALAQVESNRDAIGIVYSTDARARRGDTRLLWTVDGESAPRIRYLVTILKESGEVELARRFLDYLEGESARLVFAEAGFEVLYKEGGR